MAKRKASAVCAIIITHKPEPGVVWQILDALPRTVSVCIVDNASDSAFVQALKVRRNIHLILNSENLGIARALNQGIEFALAKGCDAVLLLDHDSIPQPGMVQTLWRQLQNIEIDGSPVASVGPRSRSRHTGKEIGLIDMHGFFFRRVFCRPEGSRCDRRSLHYLMTSGSLIPRSTIESCGGMDESLFIDYVDTEWGLRAAAAGRRSYLCCDAEILHGLGDKEVRIPGTAASVFTRNPKRSYYIFRNFLLLFGRQYIPLRWKLNELLRLALRGFLYVTLGPRRRDQFRMILQGIADGFAGRGGALLDSRT